MTDVYRHRRLDLWSVREAGRVVGHVPAFHLVGCRLHASERSRQRVLATGRREVHAWVRGVETDWCEPPATAVEVTYRPLIECGFRTATGEIVVDAEAVWLTAGGRLWISNPRGSLTS